MDSETFVAGGVTSPPADDPYFYGWRMVPRWDAEGNHHWEKVPLSPWDVLHPEEDDFIVQTLGHDRDCHYLKAAFEDSLRSRPTIEVFGDLRIDWQIPGLGVHGPDVVVFENPKAPFNVNQGTFRVKDAGARPLLVVEVTSPNTRDLDVVTKTVEYHRAGVPTYVIVNRQERPGRPTVNVVGLRYADITYELIPEDPRGVWLEALHVWIRSDGERAVCIDEHGNKIPERTEIMQQRDALKTRAEAAEKQRDAAAEAARLEKERAEAARLAAEQEKQRADDNARKLEELEAELRRLRGDAN